MQKLHLQAQSKGGGVLRGHRRRETETKLKCTEVYTVQGTVEKKMLNEQNSVFRGKKNEELMKDVPLKVKNNSKPSQVCIKDWQRTDVKIWVSHQTSSYHICHEEREGERCEIKLVKIALPLLASTPGEMPEGGEG